VSISSCIDCRADHSFRGPSKRRPAKIRCRHRNARVTAEQDDPQSPRPSRHRHPESARPLMVSEAESKEGNKPDSSSEPAPACQAMPVTTERDKRFRSTSSTRSRGQGCQRNARPSRAPHQRNWKAADVAQHVRSGIEIGCHEMAETTAPPPQKSAAAHPQINPTANSDVPNDGAQHLQGISSCVI